MKNIKRIISMLLALCFTVALTSCGEDSPQEVTPNETTQTAENEPSEEITVLSLNKEYVSHYEWYEDYPKMLVRSEYTTVTLDESAQKKYSALSQILSEASVMRKRTMEDEKDNLLADATREFMNDGEAFSTCISTLDVKVRRADSVALSILEDYCSDYGRALNGLNYDTQSGNLLTLSDVVTDVSKLPSAVENIVLKRIGEEDSTGETAVSDYFNNTSQDDINWTLEYNGITFWFNPGEIAPTNFGVQTVALTFAQYPDLFNEKYTAVPDAYTVALPLASWSYTDVTGDKQADGIFVTGDYDEDSGVYNTLCIDTDTSQYEEELFAYGLDPYYVKSADGNSYICVFSLNEAGETRDTSCTVFSLENGVIKNLGTKDIAPVNKGNNVLALPTNPENHFSVLADF